MSILVAAGEPQRLTSPTVANHRTSYEASFPELYSIATRPARRILQNRDDAEDVAAETMARLYERWARLSTRPELRAWVARVATNLALDQVRRRKPRQPPPADGPDLSDVTIERIDLAHAIRELPRRQREVVALRYFADLSDADVALALRITLPTERTHLRRALATLRPRFDLLKEQSYEVG